MMVCRLHFTFLVNNIFMLGDYMVFKLETDTEAIDNSILSSCNDRQADIGVTLFVTVTVLSESQREFQILFLI